MSINDWWIFFTTLMIEEQLAKLWIPWEQSILYLKLLEIWASPASTIARYAGCKRETCYYTLKKLIGKGLVSSINKNWVTYFFPEDPQKIIYTLESQLVLAKNILPELKLITEKKLKKFKVKFYEGSDGVKSILDQYIKMDKQEVHIYTNMWLFLELYTESYAKSLFKQKYEDWVATKLISPYSERADIFFKSLVLLPTDEILLVNNYKFHFENDIVIFDDKVIIISLSPQESYAIYIESDIFAQTQKSIFALAWLWGNNLN